jgi:hypothetical protein
MTLHACMHGKCMKKIIHFKQKPRLLFIVGFHEQLPLIKTYVILKKVKTLTRHKIMQGNGHTKKRPGQPETARDRPGTGNYARRIGILFKSTLHACMHGKCMKKIIHFKQKPRLLFIVGFHYCQGLHNLIFTPN